MEIITAPSVGFLDTRYVNVTGDTMTGDLCLQDNVYLYFDTAKTWGFKYSPDHTGLLWPLDPEGYSSFISEAGFYILSNAGADGLGNWEPSLNFDANGWLIATNVSQGNAENRYFKVDFTSGMRLDTGGRDAILKADNLATSNKTFQFPNASGTLAILETAQLFTATQKFGDADNYFQIGSGGVATLVGTARVIRDLWIDAAGIKAPGAKPATEVAFGTLETSAWSFANETVEANQRSVSWRIAIPYDFDRTEGVIIRLGWTSASTGNCKWQLKYRWFSEDEDMTQDGEETLIAVDAASTTANGLVVTDIEGIDAPGATDATIMFKLTRLSADGEDTISDTVELHGVCFNYVSDKLGAAT